MTSFEAGPDHFAASALAVCAALGQRPPEVTKRKFRWLEADRRPFAEAIEFESWIDARGLPAQISLISRGVLNDALAEWHAALPYSEAERHLVFDDDRFAANPELIRDIGRTTILDCGIEKEVSGRELMQRWYLWRRGLGQFEGADGVERARRGLHSFAAHLLPLGSLPTVEGL